MLYYSFRSTVNDYIVDVIVCIVETIGRQVNKPSDRGSE
jgi:hypothetical protein